MEWKTVKLWELCMELSDGLHKAPKFDKNGDYIFVNAQNLVNGHIEDKDPNKRTTYEEFIKYSKPLNEDTILYSIDGTIGNMAKYRGEKVVLGKGACYLTPKIDQLHSDYLYYQLQSPHFNGYINSMATGSTIKHISLKTMREYSFDCPDLPTQRRISSILSSLDAKIETNRKINEKLEAMAQALFKSWFIDFEPFKGGKFVESELGMIPEGWRVGSLSSIASYTNGLAMQKYRPNETEESLPVLKIKELGQGYCTKDSEGCSRNKIGEKYLIEDGDVIFSWSGTLLVKIWTGGQCGLNQHLFKVESIKYPRWFYYYWTLFHNDNFIRIAQDKAVTMGHIKREELDKAQVIIPSDDILLKATEVFNPLIEQLISTSKESARLANLRDTLLPKLMSGEIEV